VVATIPRLLRPLFRRRRELLRDLAQSTAEALCAFVCESLGEGLRPGVVVSIATSGDLLQWHPHLHLLTSDGGFSADGVFHPLETWDAHEIVRLFRERLLTTRTAREARGTRRRRSSRRPRPKPPRSGAARRAGRA
jgi:hypothetical protein